MTVDEFPIEIRHLMLYRQEEQHGKRDWSYFKGRRDNGFTWEYTPEGDKFWSSIYRGIYTPYYTKYGNPKVVKTRTSPLYTGDIVDFPVEVVELMLQRQFEQTGKRDVSIFENQKSGGFTWGNTPEKDEFWSVVIEDKKFDVFFEKYPKEFNSHIKTKQNDKESTTNSTGIKVFKPVATISNGEKRTGTRISGRSSKTTIGSGHLSYQAVIGY